MTKTYTGTKTVTAWPQKHEDGRPGYAVKYADGYVSWSPKEIFEASNTEVEHGAMTFGAAIEALRRGKRMYRAGWNGKNMFLFLVQGSRFKVNRAPLLGIYPEGTEVEYHPHIDMKTAQGYVVPWLASQADMLATDWVECVEQPVLPRTQLVLTHEDSLADLAGEPRPSSMTAN